VSRRRHRTADEERYIQTLDRFDKPPEGKVRAIHAFAAVPVVVTDAGKTVIVGNSNRFGAADAGTLTVLDATKIERGAEAVTGSIASGAFPRDLTLTPDGRTLLVANYGSRSLQMVDAERLPIEKIKVPER
jgi:DNA-binding beta-propeller fold protein YncE